MALLHFRALSRTLFIYIFWDLFRKFMLASGALAGIMSFGALLRPLTKYGLGLAEVTSVLFSLMPAMSTYSFPIAALFATTLVYGRLNADNEIIAMRSGGISHLWAAAPAFVLGLLVALASICMLCFVVPPATRNVEHIVYSNVGRILATSIERDHEYRVKDILNAPTIAAQGAVLLPPEPSRPQRQVVVLDSPLIVTTEKPVDTPEGRIAVPKEFRSARKATVEIEPVTGTDQLQLTILLEGGVTFPRTPEKAQIVGLDSTVFKPEPFTSPLAEKTKFMDLARLHALYANPEQDRRVQEAVLEVNRTLQQNYINDNLENSLKRDGVYAFESESGERHLLRVKKSVTFSRLKDSILRIAGPKEDDKAVHFETRVASGSAATIIESRDVAIEVTPNPAAKQIDFELRFENAAVQAGPNDRPALRDKFRRDFSLPAPEQITEINSRSAASHRNDVNLPAPLANKLTRSLVQARNEVIGELNSRMSFAVSCFILVLIGVSLGMMFKSGNSLTAFAVSVGPALLCILLNVTGQHTLENIPRIIGTKWVNPLPVGVAMIWTGNIAVLVTSAVLLYRLQRK